MSELVKKRTLQAVRRELVEAESLIEEDSRFDDAVLNRTIRVLEIELNHLELAEIERLKKCG